VAQRSADIATQMIDLRSFTSAFDCDEFASG
jgi:hypothetical protein